MPVNLPLNTATTTIPPWTPLKLKTVVVRGVMFGQVSVEVECKVIIPSEYPAGKDIPLRLTLTSENYDAIDILFVPHVIDVRLQKAMAFGNRARAVLPFIFRDHASGAFHQTELAAEANWEVDGHVKKLPTNEKNRRPRWRIEFKGALRKNPKVESTSSYEESGVALVYFVGFFPFRATADFHPTNRPNRELLIGKMKLKQA